MNFTVQEVPSGHTGKPTKCLDLEKWHYDCWYGSITSICLWLLAQLLRGDLSGWRLGDASWCTSSHWPPRLWQRAPGPGHSQGPHRRRRPSWRWSAWRRCTGSSHSSGHRAGTWGCCPGSPSFYPVVAFFSKDIHHFCFLSEEQMHCYKDIKGYSLINFYIWTLIPHMAHTKYFHSICPMSQFYIYIYFYGL